MEVCGGADARRLMGVWEAFDVAEAVRGSPPVELASGLPFDEGTALGRLPDPRAWNVLEMRPVHTRHAVRATCAAVETFRDGRGEARVAWRFKVDGTPGRLRAPSIGKAELKPWPRPRRGSIGDLIVADSLESVIHTGCDGGGRACETSPRTTASGDMASHRRERLPGPAVVTAVLGGSAAKSWRGVAARFRVRRLNAAGT